MEDATAEEISQVMEDAWTAFHVYRKLSIFERGDFLRKIASGLEDIRNSLVIAAASETNLDESRLQNELDRTIYQLSSYAAACEQGEWLEARIDVQTETHQKMAVDIRKMLVPLGPVVVFGASNFPFAYSTAGGDTACALAAGCPVIVKAHPAHFETSSLVAAAIQKAAAACDMPKGIFAHVTGSTNATGEVLVKHHYTKAVGFTGSFSGGKQLFDWGNQRAVPIPVFAEMGSVNPVFLLPEKMRSSLAVIARQLAASIALGAGQFCTNPGIIIGLDNEDLDDLVASLQTEIAGITPAAMLHTGIYKSYVEKKAAALSQPGVETLAVATKEAGFNEGNVTLAGTTARHFIDNKLLHQEVFGPYSIMVRCADMNEMREVALHLEGQLTATMMATLRDMTDYPALVEILKDICGRFIINGVPTGVEVCQAMQHGGPYPATTDSRFTAVGADGIRRFARPIAFQNWPCELLPAELQDGNPLRIYRTLNGVPGTA